jgi:hypothetical protein
MKTSRIIFYVNLGFVIFLGVGWVYFYSFILMDDVFRMPRVMTANWAIAGLNLIFLASLVLLPFTYRRLKHANEITK